MDQALARVGWIPGWVGVLVMMAGVIACAAVGGRGGTGGVAEKSGPRSRVSFNQGWRFVKGDLAGADGALSYEKLKPWVMASGKEFVRDGKVGERPAGNVGENVAYTAAGFDDSSWRALDLPHDWAIEGPFRQELEGSTGKREYWGVGWYRKRFALSDGEVKKRVFVDFDGAMSYACVWVNGKFAGGWPYGYSSFRVDVSECVRAGENVIAVRLEPPKESSRWYPGAGIYRNVWLTKTEPVHVAQWGVYVTTPEVTRERAAVSVEATVQNDGAEGGDFVVRTALWEEGGKEVARGADVPVRVDPKQRGVVKVAAEVTSPKLWDIDTPQRYVAVVTVEQGGKVVDEYRQPFGIRSIAFDAEKGFLLNGRRVPLNGVCQHHDLGPLGAAVNTRALERQVEILKEMGCNAIRTSHNPPAPELLELCDRMGVVVQVEGFDCWALAKRPGDYSKLFSDWHERDWRAVLRRDRNHPCVVMWSIGNEVREQGDRQGGHAIARELTQIAHEEDPTRPTTSGCNNGNAGYNGFAAAVDVFGDNYDKNGYAKFRKANPSQPLHGSETSSCVSSRGEYFFPVENDKAKGRADFHVSSYDLYAPPWAFSPDYEFEQLDRNPFVAGEFVWTGFDYLGEPTPFGGDSSNLLNFTDPAAQVRMAEELKRFGKIAVPSRSSYFGIVDLCGFKKDRFYIYQARWRPELAMVHVLPHWNWPERVGQVTPVHVYTSGDEAELLVNGKSMGRKKKGQYEYRLRWDEVKYEPGEVRVVAYKEGKKWAEETVRTTGEAAKLKVEADRKEIAADGRDLAFVTVSVTDQEGRVVPRAKNLLKIDVTSGELVAVDNGDPTCHRSFQSSEYPAFNGLCLAIVKATRPGVIRLRVTGEGVQAAEVTVRAK